jgi:hypothetical protein
MQLIRLIQTTVAPEFQQETMLLAEAALVLLSEHFCP